MDKTMDKEKNNMGKFAAVLGVVLLALTLFWGGEKQKETRQYQTLLENEYQQCFYNLLANVEDISVSTSKIDMATSPAQASQLLSEIWWQSNMAEDNLAAIPLSHESFDKLETLLNHTGDYCNAMSKRAMSGQELSEEEIQNIITLGKNIAAVSDELHQIEEQVNTGQLRFVTAHRDVRNGNITNGNETDSSNGATTTVAAQQDTTDNTEQTASSFNDLKTDSIEYPTLIYDGPFSDHMVNKKPEGLTGNAISMAQAKEIAMKFPALDANKEYEITEAESGNEATIPVYCFDVISKEKENQNQHQLHIDISKTGGHNIMFMDYARPETTNLSTEEGVEKAHDFLEKLGYENMQETYTINQNNVLTIAFAYKENDILMYPDQIKVQVAMDDGRIIALEAAQYFMNHKERALTAPAVSVEQAKEKVPSKLRITGEQLTVIPLDGDREFFCWEYKGIYNGEDYVVYIDANTGEQKNIVKIISTPGGNWAM